jgi:hypothetical protein
MFVRIDTNSFCLAVLYVNEIQGLPYQSLVGLREVRPWGAGSLVVHQNGMRSWDKSYVVATVKNMIGGMRSIVSYKDVLLKEEE